MSGVQDDQDFVEEEDTSIDSSQIAQFSDAVVYSSDWTVETIVSLLERGNIEMGPRFQRRDAWNSGRKSRFVESLLLGLPVPQIVLAEKKGHKGSFIILDGKQRLLSLLQFTGKSESDRYKGFALSGLEVRKDLARKNYDRISGDPDLRSDLDAFLSYTIRTVVIRNWPNTDFLHIVFLRLNTGSVKLSPQELRQAMVPGPFSNYADDTAMTSQTLRTLLSRSTPDPRMRDVELLVRFLSIQNFLSDYGGRMKSFLDESCLKLNAGWTSYEQVIQDQVKEFDLAVDLLISVIGEERIARKSGSRSFNRAIFDTLAFYCANDRIRAGVVANTPAVLSAYEQVLKNVEFIDAAESDTAGIPHTFDRFHIWGIQLRQATGLQFNIPELTPLGNRISFNGFW